MRSFSIILLFLYQFVVFQPLWVVAEFQMNKAFIVENLCESRLSEIPMCYGSCYLNKQLAKTVDDQQSNSEIPQKRILEEEHVVTLDALINNQRTCISVFQYVPLAKREYFTIPLFIDTPPPEFA